VLHYGGSALVTGAGRVDYPNGKPAFPRPECGPLCVFNDPGTAAQFAASWGATIFPLEVVPCDYVASEHTSVWHVGVSYYLSRLPRRTVLASQVTVHIPRGEE